MLKNKLLLTLLAAILVHAVSMAQIYDPVEWSYKVTALPNNEAKLEFTATLEEGWHIYSLDIDPTKGPLPTLFKFTESPDYSLLGKMNEGEYITEYDPNFEMELNYHAGKAVFTQKVKRLSTSDFKVKGEFSYMVCDESKCLPPSYIPFDLAVKGASVGDSEKASALNPTNTNTTVNLSQKGSVNAFNPESLESKIYEPVKWAFTVANETDSSAILVAKATIEPNWHVYAMNLESDLGPIPTSLHFEPSPTYELVGKPIEGEPKVTYDPNFDMDLSYFDTEAIFKQKIRKLSDKPVEISGYVTFMVCDDQKCLPPSDVDFTYTIAAGKAHIEKDDSAVLKPAKKMKHRSNWGIFIIAFFSGFAALLTPCVFPMMPMTVSFFTKQSKTRAQGIKNAIIYALSIIGIYVFLGVVVTWAFGADVLSNLATDPWFNFLFFILLVVFAISFLGAFEITLPNSWINKADSKADKGGLIGIFFMAFVLALVSFSCTGPIVGTLLVQAATQGGSAPVVGMLGFSLAIALPFALFAAFPGWLNSLPKSGGWLNSVKVVLGFLELALAFKFLSNADMVLDYGLLQREVFIAIWIVIFGLLTLYLLGKLKLPHDSPSTTLSVPRLLLGMVTAVFTIYMIPGMWGAPLKIIAAFPPPMQYSESPMGVGKTSVGLALAPAQQNEDLHLGPQNIWVYHDYDKALAHAREVNKPLMLDFTGKACVNCRKMEQQVWSDPEIKRKLSEEVVLVSLYVDLRTELPKSEQITIDLGGGRTKHLRTVGDKWAAMQEIRYRVNAQPYYVLLDNDENLLVEPANYQDYGEIDLFNDWLSRGIQKFKGQMATVEGS